MIDMARISAKGQVTIPAAVRTMLGLKEGDRVVFAVKDGNVVLVNSNHSAWQELQEAFSDAAEGAGFACEEDVVKYCSEIRQERWEKLHGRDD